MLDEADRATNATQPPFVTGLRGRCPRCGRGRLFAGFLRIAPRCETCGLDLSFADSADGPAFFIMAAVGLIVAGAALIVEIAYAPPIWLHAVIWAPLVVVLCLALLRPLKGLMVALQYAHGAEQGRLRRPS